MLPSILALRQIITISITAATAIIILTTHRQQKRVRQVPREKRRATNAEIKK